MKCTCGFDNAADARFCGRCRLAVGDGTGGAVPNAAVSATVAPVATGGGKVGTRLVSRMVMAIVAVVVVVVAAGYWWLNRPPERYKADNSGLYPIKVDGKYGFMDRSGKTVITPQFDETVGFSEGLAPVRIGTKVGYINTRGAVVITPQFDDTSAPGGIPLVVYEFRYGRACVVLGARFGFIDKDGKLVHSPDLRFALWFSGDLAPVTTATGEQAFVNRSGNEVMSGKFESVGGFTAGLAPARSGGKWGFIDTTGKWVINPQFEEARNFADGLAPVVVGGRTGYIDRKGKFVVNPQYDSGDEFSEGLASVKSGGAFSFIDTKGRVVVDAKFPAAGRFSEGLASVKTENGWGFIDPTGKTVISHQFDSAESFQNGLARVTIGNHEAYVDETGAYAGDPFKGRTIRPAHAVQEVWEGDVIGPGWKSHEKFLLYREGAKIKGFYSSSVNDPSALGNFADVAADVNPDDSVRLISDNGFIWKGRFLAPVVIAGTRPNGEEGKDPEFPFRLYFVRDATTDDLPAPLQPTSSDWEAFLAKFKEAIAQRDQASLSVILGRTFYLQNARLRSVDDVFDQLNWQQLAKAIADGALSDRKSPLGRRRQFITDAHPCPNCVYQVTLTFSQDADGQWRWTGVTYPGD